MGDANLVNGAVRKANVVDLVLVNSFSDGLQQRSLHAEYIKKRELKNKSSAADGNLTSGTILSSGGFGGRSGMHLVGVI